MNSKLLRGDVLLLISRVLTRIEGWPVQMLRDALIAIGMILAASFVDKEKP